MQNVQLVQWDNDDTRRVKKFRSKLNGRSLIRGINVCAGIVGWRKEEHVNMDSKTKKVMAMHECSNLGNV